MLSDARSTLAAYERYLAPGHRADITGAIATTLRIYFDPEFDDGGVDQAAMEAWLMDLADLPGWAVVEACSQWRKRNERRPTPAGIRNLALQETERDRETLRRLRLTCDLNEAA